MNSKQAIAIASQNGYGIGRNGKKGYYLTYVNGEGKFIRMNFNRETNMSAVVQYAQENPNSSPEYREYVQRWTSTMPAICEPLTYERWLQATAKEEAQANINWS